MSQSHKVLPCGMAWCVCESSSNQTEQESKYLPAVSKTVDKEVDAAVDAQKKMANEENLRAHRNLLKKFNINECLLPPSTSLCQEKYENMKK